MADTDLKITFGADTAALVDGVGLVKSQIQSLASPVAGLQAAFAGLSANLTAAFAAVDVGSLTGAMTQASAAVAGVGADLANLSGQLGQVGAATTRVVATTQTGTAAITRYWHGVVDPLVNDTGRMFEGMINGTETFHKAMIKFGEDIEHTLFAAAERTVENWIVSELTKTAATSAGAAARTTAESTAASTGTALSAQAGLKQVGNDAAQAASGAYKALAGVPIIGPALGAAAAIAAFASVIAFGGKISSAAGGWADVPVDGALAQLHKNEMVLPATLANPLRQRLAAWDGPTANASAAAGGAEASGDTHHWHINALDPRSFETYLRRNSDVLAGVLNDKVRGGAKVLGV